MVALMVFGAVRFKIHCVPTEKLAPRAGDTNDGEGEGREKGLGIKIREGRPQMYTHTELRRRVRAY